MFGDYPLPLPPGLLFENHEAIVFKVKIPALFNRTK
jgi:hypothetical protein